MQLRQPKDLLLRTETSLPCGVLEALKLVNLLQLVSAQYLQCNSSPTQRKTQWQRSVKHWFCGEIRPAAVSSSLGLWSLYASHVKLQPHI